MHVDMLKLSIEVGLGYISNYLSQVQAIEKGFSLLFECILLAFSELIKTLPRGIFSLSI
jgi:hypothetical protein